MKDDVDSGLRIHIKTQKVRPAQAQAPVNSICL